MAKLIRNCSPALSRHIDRLYHLSLAFGAWPLLAGVAVFVLYYLTEADLLWAAGLLVVAGGLISVIVASICLAVCLYWERGINTSSKVLRRRGLLCAAIIISNLPAAYACTSGALYLMDRYTLTVENKSTSALDSLLLSAPGVNRQVARLAPNETRTLKFMLEGTGSLEFSARQNATQFSGVIEPYYSAGMPGAWSSLIIKNNCQYEVKRIRYGNWD